MTINEIYLSALLDFLVKNQPLILSPTDVSSRFKTKSTVSTPLSHIFGRAAELGLERLMCLVNAGASRGVAVPEVFTRTHLTFDIMQMGAVTPHLPASVKMFPSMDDKIVLNITQMVRSNGEFVDLQSFQNTIVRDLLSRSFYQDRRPVWLTPNITQFVCKVYSMSLATSVARWYNLDYATQSSIASVFAYFFMTLMSNEDTAKVLLKSRWKQFHVPEPAQLQQILDLSDDTCGGAPKSLEEVFLVISKFAPARVSLSRSMFLTGMQNLGPDYYTTAISLEYPPYFLYLILLAMSGRKNGLSIFLKNVGLLRDGVAMADEVAISPTFLQSL